MDEGPIPYIERTRRYYAALGYATPYRWARHDDVPFHALPKPLGARRVALVTTATPILTARHRYDAAAKFFAVTSGDTQQEPDLRINHVAIDFKHTTGADQGSFFPLHALRRAVDAGRIGALTRRFHGAPTNRSQRATRETDAPEILARCQEDGAEAAILVPNCPVCHQTVSLIARHLEANGIATVIMGCARDIVETAGVPRFLFSDFPLGNAAGKPHDIASQDLTLGLALDLLEQATAPRATVQSPLRWSDDASWKQDYGNIDGLTEEEFDRLRAEFDQVKAVAKQRREN
jgi:hypothetical protein